MKKEVSMVKLVLVMLFALSFITIAGVESGISGKTETYRCALPHNTCSFAENPMGAEVYCEKQNWRWSCSFTETAQVVCKRSSQKRTFSPSFNFTAYEACSALCGGCATDWMRAR